MRFEEWRTPFRVTSSLPSDLVTKLQKEPLSMNDRGADKPDRGAILNAVYQEGTRFTES